MSFMDILLKSDSTSVYDILKHQKKKVEIKKQYTVQDSIIEYLGRDDIQTKWGVASRQKLGRVISNRRLNAIFEQAKRLSDITQLDETDERLHFSEPKRDTEEVPSVERVSARSQKGKSLMQDVLLKVSKVVGEEESKIVLALRDFIDEGKSRPPTRAKTDLESLIGGNNGLIDRLRSGRENSVFNNSRLKLAGIFHEKFLLRLGKAIREDNKANAFHPNFWEEFKSGEPPGIEIFREFLHSQNSTIPDIEKLKGFHRQLLSGDLFNASNRVRHFIKQKEQPDEEIYDFQNEGVVQKDIDKILEYAKRVVAKLKTNLDKFKDETSGSYTDVNHETNIHDITRGMSNRELAEIDFDVEFGNLVEKDIGRIEQLWESLSEIKEALAFITEKTNIQIDSASIDEIQQERFDLINSIANYSNYLQSYERLTQRRETGQRQLEGDTEDEAEEPESALDNLKQQYLHIKLRTAQLSDRGFTKRREQTERERSEERFEKVKKDIMDLLKDLQEKDKIPDANRRYTETIRELEQQHRERLQGEEE